jgi:hypothetical protein
MGTNTGFQRMAQDTIMNIAACCTAARLAVAPYQNALL